MKWEPKECRFGDMIRIRLGSVYHFGVFVSEDEVIQFGLPPTAENRAKEGEVVVIATDIDIFACGCIIEVACFDKGELRRRNSPEKTVELARARLGEGGYNLIHNNCEHFANECVFGESRCSQEEEMRRRFRNRPICDVYLTRVEENGALDEAFPEKLRKELSGKKNEDERSIATAQWKLLQTAARRSFQTELCGAALKRKLGGRWVCDRFGFAFAASGDTAAVAVSNGEVSLALSEKPFENGRVLKSPRIAVQVKGEKADCANFFWVEGEASRLLGSDAFEQES